MAQQYNPLLKYGFQKTDSGAIADLQAAITELQTQAANLQTALNALKGNKITKCFSASDLAEIGNGEIIQWQGESQTVDGVDYVNGYFYKKSQTGQVVIIPENQPCFIYNSTSLYARGTINFYDYSLTYDDYYVAGELQPENSNLTSIDCRTFGNGRYYALFVESPLTCVGSIVFDTYNLVSIGVTRCFYDENNRYALTLELENGITVAVDSGSFGRLSVIWDCYSTNGNHIAVLPWSLVGSQKYLLADYSISGNTVTINDWTLFGATEGTTAEPITIDTTVETYSRTDTQPRIQGVNNAQDGSIVISRDVEFSGNITVHGTQTIVDTQEIDSENDFINLRVNNPLALAEDEMSGLSVKNYDGNGNNLDLVVDKNGWARVGDENGTLQKLATIEENPTDGKFVKYNTTTKQLESGTIPTPAEATTTTAGLMSAADKDKLDNIETGAQKNPTNGMVVIYTPTGGTFNCIKCGHLVSIYCVSSSTSSSSITIASQFRPLYDISTYAVLANLNSVARFSLTTGGVLSWYGSGVGILTFVTN